MDFVTNWVTNKIAGYATTGIQAGGSLAGNAVGGVGTLLENSGRAVGQSANGVAGAIGGVGGYINNYGQQVQNSMAADGPVSEGAPKKTAVKAATASMTSAVPRAIAPRTVRVSAASGTARQLPSTAARASTKPSAPALASFPSKAPPRAAHNLPSKKLMPTRPAANGCPSRPPVSSSQSARAADGRIKTSATNRAKPVKATAANSKDPKRFNNSKRPSVATSQSERTADGKVKIAANSRPRAV